MKLYPYQKENSDNIMELWKSHNSVLYQLPTGGGKTVVINDIIEKILDKKIIILVHRQEIIFQIRDRLKKRGITAGILIGSFEENIDSDIIIGSILTVSRDSRLQNIFDRDFDYMIIDEAHHACSNSYIKTINHFKEHNPNYRLLGVTATPYRKDKKKLSNIFDVLIKGPTYSELRKGGYLSDYTCYAAKLEGLSEVNLSGGDFKLSSLSKYMRADWLLDKAIKMYKDKGNDEQMLIFCVDKKHAIQTKKAYESKGFKSIAIIDSDTDDITRKSINTLYREKKLKIIVSVQTLTEGVDLPETKVVQLLRPTLSVVLYLQILGRGTRIKEDGSKLIILDLSNNSYEHGLLDSEFVWNLNNDEPNPSKKINKIGGKNKKGRFTIDVDEIEEEYLEVEEMSHEDYLLQNVNGIEIAENENREKDKLVELLYANLCNYLNTKCKIKSISFKTWKENLSQYGNWEEIDIVGFKSDNYVLKYNTNGEVISLHFGWTNKYTPDLLWKSILQGKLSEFFSNEKLQLYLVKSFKEIRDVIGSKINIQDLKQKAEDIEIEKCIFKINSLLERGIYKFPLKTFSHLSNISPRSWYGKFTSITFNDSPKRLKVNNNISVLVDGRIEKNFPNSNRELIVKVLYNNWYK